VLVLMSLQVIGSDGTSPREKRAVSNQTVEKAGRAEIERVNPKDWRNFKKPADKVLKQLLTPMQYKVTQKNGTEPPFTNEYATNHRQGIYVDIVLGEPLFSSGVS
jgi:hypothetical protein